MKIATFLCAGIALCTVAEASGAVSTTEIDGKQFFLECKGRTNRFVRAEGNELLSNDSYYDAAHIWTFEKTGTSDNTYYLKNPATDSYVSAVPSQNEVTFKLVDKAEAGAYTVDFSISEGYAVIYDAKGTVDRNALHVNTGGKVVRWDTSADASMFSLIDATNVAEALNTYYTIECKTGGFLGLDDSYKDNNGLKLTNSTKPTSLNGMWHVVNTPEGNIRFINAGDAAAGKVLEMSGSEASARAKMVSPAAVTGDVDFNGTIKLDGTASYIKIASSANNYFNKRSGYLALWDSSKAVGDNGSTFYISPVDPDDSMRFSEYNTVNPGTRPEGVSDMTLWYNVPVAHTGSSNTWMEYALPLGNGQLGATVRGGIFKDEIQFNEKTLWAGRPAWGGNKSVQHGGYQNFGSIMVIDRSSAFSTADATVPVNNYVRWLDIADGVAGVNYEGATTNYKRRYFVSATDGVFIARYEADGTDKLALSFAYVPDRYINASSVTYNDATASFSGKTDVISYATTFKVIASEGATVTTGATGITVENATWAELIMAAATDYDASTDSSVSGAGADAIFSQAKTKVDAAAEKSYDSAVADHTAAFSALMNRVSFKIGAVSDKPTDKLIDFYNAAAANKTTAEGLGLEQLYFQYGRYMTVASNFDTSIHAPSNLQGIWNDISNSDFWRSDIHADINVQMNYWPADPTNLSEMHRPFVEHIIDVASRPDSPWKAAAQLCKSGARGWTVAVENNILGGGSTWALTTIKSMGAWYCTHLWRYYQYTLDRDFLTRALPVMYDAALFIKDIATKDSKGLYEITGEWSPEHGPYNQVTAFSQQNAYELLDEIFKAHEELGADSPLTETQLDEIRELYANFDRGVWVETYNGKECISEWKTTALTDPGHRHLSHLMCLYPYSMVSAFDTTEEGKRLFRAAYNGQIARNGDVTGWSMGWQTNTYARALDGNRARLNLTKALRHSTSYAIAMSNQGGCYYNLFDAHSPFQIDGNFGCTSGIAEMLLQSYDGIITLLPALPDAWTNGSVSGLKALGDYTVDINWENGKGTTATVTNNRQEARSAKIRIGDKILDADFGPGESVNIDMVNGGIESSVVDLEAALKPAAPAKVYDLLGRTVARPANGLYIANGKVVRL